MMEAEPQKDSSDKPVSSDDITETQKQINKGGKRIREENMTLEEHCRESDKFTIYESLKKKMTHLRREAETVRHPSTSRVFNVTAKPEDVQPSLRREVQYQRRCVSEKEASFLLKQALAAIPMYDGQNIPVLQFSRACKKARDIIPDHLEQMLTKLAITKLRGRASIAIEDAGCVTINSFCDRLKDVFSPQRTVDHYRGDLANIFMKPDEHMLDYISRVKDLRDAIIDCDRDNADYGSINNLTANSFINGVIPQVRAELRNMRKQPLNAIYDAAIQSYKQLELDEVRYGKSSSETGRAKYCKTTQTATHSSPPNDT